MAEEEVDEIENEKRIEQMVDQYQNLVLSVCYKLTRDYFAAQDLTQETFLSAYEHLSEFDGRNEKGWLCRIAANKSVDYLRRTQKMLPVEDEKLEQFPSAAPLPEESALESDVRRELLENCRKLRFPYDEVAYRYFYLGEPPGEIARELGKKIKTVQTQVYRARKMLRVIYRRTVRL